MTGSPSSETSAVPASPSFRLLSAAHPRKAVKVSSSGNQFPSFFATMFYLTPNYILSELLKIVYLCDIAGVFVIRLTFNLFTKAFVTWVAIQ